MAMLPRSYLLRSRRGRSPSPPPRGGPQPLVDDRYSTPRGEASGSRTPRSGEASGSRSPRSSSSPPDRTRGAASPRFASVPPPRSREAAAAIGSDPGPPAKEDQQEGSEPSGAQASDPPHPAAEEDKKPEVRPPRPFEIPFELPQADFRKTPIPLPLKMCLGSGIPIPHDEGGYSDMASRLFAKASASAGSSAKPPTMVMDSVFVEKPVKIMSYDSILEATGFLSDLKHAPFGDKFYFGLVEGRQALIKFYNCNNIFELEEVSLRLLHSTSRAHPNVLKLIGQANAKDSCLWFLVYDFNCKMSLHEFLKGHPSWQVRVHLAYQVASALQHISTLDDDMDRAIIPTQMSCHTIWMGPEDTPIIIDAVQASHDMDKRHDSLIKCIESYTVVLAKILGGNMATDVDPSSPESYFSQLMQELSNPNFVGIV